MRRSLLVGWLTVLLMSATHVHADGARDKRSDKQAPAAKQLPPLEAGSVFAFLPAPSQRQAGAASTDNAVRAISEYLRTHGFRVLPAAQVRSKLSSHALEGCKDPTTCDPALALATLRADAVISTAVWQRPSAPTQLVVHVRRQQGYGQAEINVPGSSAKDLRTAAVKALQEALEDSQQTHEIKVLIESLPMGATVRVDQTLTGTTPAHFSLLPGSHLVSVEAAGFVTRAQYLELPERGMSETRLELKLTHADAQDGHEAEPPKTARRERGPKPKPAAPPVQIALASSAASPAATSEATRDTSSSTNYVVAAVLLGIAAPLVANAIYGAATHGSCVGEYDSRGNCSERVGLGPFFYLSAGLGGLALLGGSAFLIFQPLQFDQAGGYALDGAALQLTNRF